VEICRWDSANQGSPYAPPRLPLVISVLPVHGARRQLVWHSLLDAVSVAGGRALNQATADHGRLGSEHVQVAEMPSFVASECWLRDPLTCAFVARSPSRDRLG
jgi:hypothetical protein